MLKQLSKFYNDCFQAKDYVVDNIKTLYSKYDIIIARSLQYIGTYLILTSIVEPINYMNCYILANILWVFFGIASSIGFGTGFHTGIMFLVPHVTNIYKTAQECNNTDFKQYSNEAFICNNESPISENLNHDIFIKAIPAVFLWGVGTALGEVPPYFVAAAIKDKLQFDAYFKGQTKYCLDIIVHYLLKYRFLTIMILASWPNATFDMCGMACGFYKIPFSTFIGATILGKAFIKAPTQLYFFVNYVGDMMSSIEDDNILIQVWKYIVLGATLAFIKVFIETLAEKQRDKFKKTE